MPFDFDLCVLIPSFNNIDGVKRIVETFCELPNVSIIVSDDSDDIVIANAISSFISSKCEDRISYIKREGSAGAVHNWNYLLTQVNANFYTLVHHDEFHTNTKFLEVVTSYYNQRKSCLVLPFTVQNKNGIKRKVSSPLQRRSYGVLKIFLPVFNFIGPTSSLIISQDVRPHFDSKLTWLVDTEWYSRVFSLSENINFLSRSSSIRSVFYENSITWSSNGAVRGLLGKELSALRQQYPSVVRAWRFYGFFYCRIVVRLLGFPSYMSFYIRRLGSFLTK